MSECAVRCALNGTGDVLTEELAQDLKLTHKVIVLQFLEAVVQLFKPHGQRVSVVCVQCDLPVEGLSACMCTNEFIICQGMTRVTRIAVCRCEAREL
jgi:hypothetical protein